MKNTTFLRVRDQRLSLWQAVVWERLQQHSKENGGKTLNRLEIGKHPITIAVNQMVALEMESDGRAQLASGKNLPSNVMLIHTAYQLAQAIIKENEPLVEYLETAFRKYSNEDWFNFIAIVLEDYLGYGRQYDYKLKYNDWQVEGKGDINYGVIKYKLPNNAKVAILGDWGTGMPDAVALLKEIMHKHNPDAIIHLGDIYYAGSPSECWQNFAEVFEMVFAETKKVPVFTIPGNHDYYSYGYGYYQMVSGLNKAFPDAIQPASYFCLQTQDMGWQFLAMDTGYGDSDPFNQINEWYAGPQLQASEIKWHHDKLNKFKGGTILLSHHQVFTANSAINGRETHYPPYLNSFLQTAFEGYLQSHVGLWLWGHEHNLVLYKNNLFGVAKGRLVGCSAFEEETSQDPYAVVYPQVPYLDPSKYRLSADNGYYNHGYAVIDFSTRKFPEDKAEISYFEFPSWAIENPPPDPQARLILNETFEKPHAVGPPVNYNQNVYISSDGVSTYFAPLYSGTQYYPRLGSPAVQLQIQKPTGGGQKVYSGDQVMIVTLEIAAGKYNRLSAYARKNVYYYTGNSDPQRWVIRKLNNDFNGEIRSGDFVTLENMSYKGQFLSPNGEYITTKALSDPPLWQIKLVNPGD